MCDVLQLVRYDRYQIKKKIRGPFINQKCATFARGIFAINQPFFFERAKTNES